MFFPTTYDKSKIHSLVSPFPQSQHHYGPKSSVQVEFVLQWPKKARSRDNSLEKWEGPTQSTGLPRWLSGKESTCQVGDAVRFLSWEDPLEKEMATQAAGYMGLQTVWHNLATEQQSIFIISHPNFLLPVTHDQVIKHFHHFTSVAQSCPTLCDPMDYIAARLFPPRKTLK